MFVSAYVCMCVCVCVCVCACFISIFLPPEMELQKYLLHFFSQTIKIFFGKLENKISDKICSALWYLKINEMTLSSYLTWVAFRNQVNMAKLDSFVNHYQNDNNIDRVITLSVFHYVNCFEIRKLTNNPRMGIQRRKAWRPCGSSSTYHGGSLEHPDPRCEDIWRAKGRISLIRMWMWRNR